MGPAFLQRALAAQSAEALRTMAEAEHIHLTEQEAERLYARLHTAGELSDWELDAVSGGGCGQAAPRFPEGSRVLKTGLYCCDLQSRVACRSDHWIVDRAVWEGGEYVYSLHCPLCRNSGRCREAYLRRVD